MRTTLTWDDGLAERELASPTVDDLESRIAALDGVDRTLVTIYRGGAHLAIGGSAADGLVVYCAFDNETFWQLLGEAEADGSITVFAGGQEGSYPVSHVTTFEDAVLAAREFLVDGKCADDLHWERRERLQLSGPDRVEVTDELSLEVAELTDLLRSDPHFATFREALRRHGLDPSQVLLGGLIDDEDGGSYCAFVTEVGCIAAEFAGGSETRWEEVPDPARLLGDFSAIEVAAARAGHGRWRLDARGKSNVHHVTRRSDRGDRRRDAAGDS